MTFSCSDMQTDSPKQTLTLDTLSSTLSLKRAIQYPTSNKGYPMPKTVSVINTAMIKFLLTCVCRVGFLKMDCDAQCFHPLDATWGDGFINKDGVFLSCTSLDCRI